MKVKRSARHWCSLGLCGIALLWPALTPSATLAAGPKRPFLGRPGSTSDSASPVDPVDSETREETVPVEPVSPVRLNHLRTPWDKVLKLYASAVNKELVMKSYPKGTFTRVDLNSHPPKVALAILNKELQPLGYKLDDMGSHLVLIEVRKTRIDYKPFELPSTEPPPENSRDASSRDNDVQQAGGEAPVKKRTPTNPVRTASGSSRDEAVDALPPAAPSRRIVPAQADAEPPPPSKTVLTRFDPQGRQATTLHQMVYKAFQAQSEPVKAGPRNLPGFRVLRADVDKNGNPTRSAGERPVKFGLYIDEELDQLVIAASAEETRSVEQLLRTIDRKPADRQTTVRAVQTTKDARKVAEVLQPELSRLTVETRKALRAQRAKFAQGRGGEEALAQAAPPAGPGRGRAAPEGDLNPPPEDEPAGIAGSLKGEVSVEAIPELGILIVKGNQQDVEAVMEVIREIERLSVGAAPRIELLLLRFVSSESLAPLLQSVYDRLNPGVAPRQGGPAAQAQSSSILPIVRPNAVLIIASAAEIEPIVELAEKLDQPVDPQMNFRVFRLRHATSTQVENMLQTIYGGGTTGAPGVPGAQGAAAQAGSTTLAPRVTVVPDPRTNSVIVQARPGDMQEVAQLINQIDTDDIDSISQMRIIKLNFALADELAVTLQTAFQSVLTQARITSPAGQGGQQFQQPQAQGQGQGDPSLREVRSQILEFLGPDGSEERRYRSGILSDVRINSDFRTNSIVVTAPEASMALIEALIRRFDMPSAAVADIKVFKLEKSDATAMVTLLQNLFNVQAAQRQGQPAGAAGAGAGILGIQISDSDEAGNTLIPLRFSTDIRTNSVIAIGGAEALRVVEAILIRLDTDTVQQRESRVFKLKNTYSPDVALAIQTFLQTQQQAILQADVNLISPFEQFEREVVVVSEPVTNSLLISATPRYIEHIMAIIEKLDAMPKQVIIQMLLVEVSLNNQDEFGVEIGGQDSILFNRSIIRPEGITTIQQTFVNPSGNSVSNTQIISQESIPGYNFRDASLPLGNNVSPGINTQRIGSQGLSSFNLGRVNGDLGYGGLVVSAGSENLSVLLRALAARTRVDVLSRPQIRTLENQLSQIQVGQAVPLVNGFNVNANTGNAAPIVQYRDVGIILQVTPRITPEGMVVMAVQARKDALNPEGVPIFANPNGSTVDSPIIDTTNAIAVVSVRSGQTVVLGGMITRREEVFERKVPMVGDIPIFGQLFRYDSKRTAKTELLIFITPRVIDSDADSEFIKEVETQRINFVEAEAEAIHGPLFGIPATPDWAKPAAPVAIPIPGTLPKPPAPGLPGGSMRPMSHSYEDGEVPTTIIDEPAKVPPFPEENLDIDLSKARRKSKRDSAVVQAGYEVDASPAAPSQASKNSSESKSVRPTQKKAGPNQPVNSRTKARAD